MGPKSTLRLMRILGPSLASLAQSTWILSNALRGKDCIPGEMHSNVVADGAKKFVVVSA